MVLRQSNSCPITCCRCGVVYVPSDVVGWKPFVQSWLNAFLARQHAAAQQSPEAPAPDPELLPEQQECVVTVNGNSSQAEIASATGTHSGVGNAVHNTGSCSGNELNNTCLECPDELRGVWDFIWSLFETFVEPLLQWVAEHGNTLLPVVPVAQLSAMAVLFEAQADALR